jgi:rare lipoprotein A (peptidoglycan hydrolase)
METRNYLKKAMYWLAVFLCILSTGSVSVSIGCKSASIIQWKYEQIIDLENTDYSWEPIFGPLSVRPEKYGYLTLVEAARPASLNMSGEVTTSWYGEAHHNKITASGQRFDMHKNTLAHRTLPLGTKVRLVNPENGKSIEGFVNDRGPYIKGRDVDVSYAMAKQLGFVRKGVTKLYMETIQVVAEAKI